METGLYRSRTNKMIGGVCGGFAQYFNIDPVIVRLIFVLSVFLHGTGILAYIVCLIIMPEENIDYMILVKTPPEQDPQDQDFTKKKSNNGYLMGVILILLGSFFLIDNVIPGFEFLDFLPVIFVVIGIWVMVSSVNKKNVWHCWQSKLKRPSQSEL
jgi:phage shock protein PspC (stress-responsive transcriptional regulator)